MEFIKIIKGKILSFLNNLYKGNGFFSYSLFSDIYSPDINWGLGNTVFAVKTYFILRYLDELDKQVKSDIINFIKHFQRKGGVFRDPLVYRKTFIINKIAAIKNLNFSNFFSQKTIMAETRQAIVALILFGEKPTEPFVKIPYTFEDVDIFFNSLDKRNIWGAASHIGHLIFFLKTNADLFNFKKEESNVLINYCLNKIDALQDKKDGLWFSNTNFRQKINAAMKIVSAFNLIKRRIRYAEKIIDFILDIKDEYYYDACDYLNVMYVLKYAFDTLGKDYRNKDIYFYCERSIEKYKKYFFEEIGGFSFLPNDNSRKYYGMKVTKRFLGPDIHGTMLFAWAVSLVADILNINRENFQEIIN